MADLKCSRKGPVGAGVGVFVAFDLRRMVGGGVVMDFRR